MRFLKGVLCLKGVALWIPLLIFCVLGSGLYAQEGTYVTVVSPNAMLWATPDAAVSPNYQAATGGAYEVVATANGFVKVVWIGGDMGWISESHVEATGV